MENRQLSRNSALKTYNVVGSYAVQCGLCFKWSNIPTKEEYETIRHSFIEDPWVCSKKQGGSCDSPADLEYDTSRMWIADRPNIPKPPPGFERVLSRRSDFSKFDVYYVTPMGKKLRGPSDVEKLIQENPQYNRLNPSDFVFSSPKISKEMVRGTPAEEGNTNPNKKLKRS
ncbi:methyl-CpG-binding domain-containing protein 4-like [Aristolochia californica]|uniref:methyl-CpG-binding domain-containing protein 4-like n=1 Tax=Aristolochia californica TaxID=171875 RepID=UPI0035DB3C1C